MSVGQIMNEIEKLSEKERLEIYAKLVSRISKREEVLASLEKYKGKAQGLWNMDAQDYVNQLRAE